MYASCQTHKRMIINATDHTYSVETIPAETMRKTVGGRGLNILELFQRTDQKTDPFSPENPLLLAPGALVGTASLYANRLTISSKSPLTGLCGDSNIGGEVGVYMKWAGYDQIIITGKSEVPVYLEISPGGCKFKNAEHLWGMNTGAARAILNEEKRPRVSSPPLLIGPAGENLVRYACIVTNGHAAGRTGMGAVMGSKKIKAIRFSGRIPSAPPGKSGELMRKLNAMVESDPAIAKAKQYGATTAIEGFNKLGILEVKNLQYGTWDQVDRISGKTVRDTYNVSTHGCMYCPIKCKGVSSFKNTGSKYGDFVLNGPEFAALQNFGARILNPDPVSTCYLTDISNQLGIDFMSFGAIASWLMECYEKGAVTREDMDGLDLTWGNVDAVEALMRKTALREGVGDHVAEGAYRFAGHLGDASRPYLLTVKKMEFEGCDPRGMKGRGVAFGVASRGADNCRSLGCVETTVTPMQAKDLFGSEEASSLTGVSGKGKMIKYMEDLGGIADLLGLCKFSVYVFVSSIQAMLDRMDVFAELYAEYSGCSSVDEARQILLDASERTVNMERLYNLREGLTRNDDILPERFRKEPMPDGPAKGSVVENEIILDEYYEARGWSLSDGTPTVETLKRLCIEFYGIKYPVPETIKK